MAFPEEGFEAVYRSNLQEVTRMLQKKHTNNYIIINLSKKRYDIAKYNPQVHDYGWPEQLAPPLETLCSICKTIDSWLNTDPQHVVVVHCKGGPGRLGVVIAAYMHYSSICASAEGALDRFAMKKFYDDKLGGLTQPSQKRYVHYFAGLLSGAIKINNSPLFLHQLVIHGVPNFDGRGGCRPFIKVYHAMQPVYTSGVYNVANTMQRVCITPETALQLRGDVLIKCYNRGDRQRDVIFRCQFHTCAISNFSLTFNKQELDDATSDERFPESGKVEVVFSDSPHKPPGSTMMGDQGVVMDNGEQMVRWDSYENFNSQDSGSKVDGRIEVNHTQGPVDGSLYATVTKKPPHREKDSSTVIQNGNTSLLNGPLTVSVDSGIASSPGYPSYQGGSHTVHSYQTSTQNYTTQSSSSQQASALPHSPPTLGQQQTSPSSTLAEESSQLDDILSELLGDQMLSTSPMNTMKSSTGANATAWQLSPTSPNRSLAMPSDLPPNTRRTEHYSYTAPDGSSKMDKTTSYENRSQMGPGSKSESKVVKSTSHYSSSSSSAQPPIEGSHQPHVESSPRRYIPQNAFSYTSGGLDEAGGRVTSPTFRANSPKRSPSPLGRKSPTSPNLNSVPYSVGYENRSEESWQEQSWLEQQKMKLAQKRGGDYNAPPQFRKQHSYQEKALVAELVDVQNKIARKRVASESDQAVLADRTNVQVSNGPMTQSAPQSDHNSNTYKAQKDYYVSGVEVDKSRPFSPTPSKTEYTFMIKGSTLERNQNESNGAKTYGKPPPSPIPGRNNSAPGSPLIPQRSSSRGAVARSRSSTDWTKNSQLQRQNSDLTYDRDKAPLPIQRTPLGSSGYSYTTEEITTHRPQPKYPAGSTGDFDLDALINETTTTTKKSTSSSYSSSQLDDLERSIQALIGVDANNTANNVKISPIKTVEEEPIINKKVSKTTKQSVNSGYESDSAIFANKSYETRSYETKQMNTFANSKPPRSKTPDIEPQTKSRFLTFPHKPKKVEMDYEIQESYTLKPIAIGKSIDDIETYSKPRVEKDVEDKITLRPIGPGMQTLEPDTGTIGRSRPTTPLFPVSQVSGSQQQVSYNTASSPGPRSPRTPYVNQASPPVQTPTFPRTGDYTAGYAPSSASGYSPSYTAGYAPSSASGYSPSYTGGFTQNYSPTQVPRTPYVNQVSDPGLHSPNTVNQRIEQQNIQKMVLQQQASRMSDFDPTYESIPDDVFQTRMLDRQTLGGSQQMMNGGSTVSHQWSTEQHTSGNQVVGGSQTLRQQSSGPPLQHLPPQTHPSATLPSRLHQQQQQTIVQQQTIQQQQAQQEQLLKQQQEEQLLKQQKEQQLLKQQHEQALLKYQQEQQAVLQQKQEELVRKQQEDQRRIIQQQQEQQEQLRRQQEQALLKQQQEQQMLKQQQEQALLKQQQELAILKQQQEQALLKQQQELKEQQERLVRQQQEQERILKQQQEQEMLKQQETLRVQREKLQQQQQALQKQQQENLQQQQIIQQQQSTLQREISSGSIASQQMEPHVPGTLAHEQLHQQRVQQQQVQQQQQQAQQQQVQTQQVQKQVQYTTKTTSQQQSSSQQQQQHQQVHQNGQTNLLHIDTQHSGSAAQRSPISATGSDLSPQSPGSLHLQQSSTMSTSQTGHVLSPTPYSFNSGATSPGYFGTARRGSGGSSAGMDGTFDLQHHTPKFVRDTSKFWYKPHISREEAISLLKDKPPGTFVVRDSNSFPGAFGLALKVAQVPPNVQTKSGDPSHELVRHFLIEPTPKGVKLKGCSNEPVFSSLAALVYQHSITPLALPCKLFLPEIDTVDGSSSSSSVTENPSSAGQLLSHGAACNVIYLNSVDIESLTGPQAVAKAMRLTFSMAPPPKHTVVHFKVSSQGITLTDNKRKLFFRRHYPVSSVTFCGMDPEDRRWNNKDEDGATLLPNAKMFGFVARKQGSNVDNACHIFTELDPDQPASAIVNFVSKVMIGARKS
ncbi:unnamed protein product [Owenia fusiformis]|uniref:Phosphatidylinositol-3,4,5-trisphosphate 3-phosphatase n=1 Tax=Owenia fusiformis TaxID=6347 RepID=A0A8S4P4T5_OWEFU|nr:unnamed protein product [Owenia fusiformis]